VVSRGEIWWANLPEPVASEPGYRRPILIVQSDTFNQSRIATLLAVALSSNLKLSQAPGNLLLPRKTTGLAKDSVANVSQVITVDKRFLTEQIGVLPAYLLGQVEDGLRLILDL